MLRTTALFLSLLSLPLMAPAQSQNDSQEKWYCMAEGTINLGEPAGIITRTVVGYGPTEYEAFSQAQQNCYSEGLRGCFVTFCGQEEKPE